MKKTNKWTIEQLLIYLAEHPNPKFSDVLKLSNVNRATLFRWLAQSNYKTEKRYIIKREPVTISTAEKIDIIYNLLTKQSPQQILEQNFLNNPNEYVMLDSITKKMTKDEIAELFQYINNLKNEVQVVFAGKDPLKVKRLTPKKII